MHKIYEKNGKKMIERTTYPRWVGEITFGQLSDVENITFIDPQPTDVMEGARLMREAGDFINNSSR